MADQVDPRGDPHVASTTDVGLQGMTSKWSEHSAPTGRKYYYNSVTGESTWERPAEFASSPTDLSRQHSATSSGVATFQPQQQAPLMQGQQAYAGYPPQYGQPMTYAPYAAGGFMYPYPQPYAYTPQVAGPGPPIQTTESGQGPPGCNLFVFHIPNDMTNQDLFNYFAAFGNVISARIMVEKETGRSRGFGFVSYDNAPSADAAIAGMNGFQVGRKRLKVQHKKERGQQQMFGELPAIDMTNGEMTPMNATSLPSNNV